MNKGLYNLRIFRNDPEPSIEQFNLTEMAMMTSMARPLWD